MADIELVIKIPDQMYQKIKETSMFISGRRSGKRFDYILFNAVNTGTLIPKGHGRLIDADALEGHSQIQIVPCGNGKYVEVMTYYQNDIDVAPTIIKPDKAESEG